MEGVGARLGRSSNRYGTASTVFTGPVRKWKKKWVHVTPPPSSSSSAAAAAAAASNSNNLDRVNNNNGSVNGNNNSNGSSSLLKVYKWAPVGNEEKKREEEEEEGKEIVEPKRRRYKYIPIAVLEEQGKGSEENTDDGDEKAIEVDTADGPISRNGGVSEKPDINDVPMEESQGPEQNENVSERQDLNVSTLDLSLGLSSHEEEQVSDRRAKRNKGAQPRSDG